MPLFKRKPKQPLDEVFAHIGAAVEILYTYKRDKGYQPSDQELPLFTRAQQALWEASCTAGYIERCLHQRFRGEAEGSKKWHDKDTFDYHYPERQS